MTEDLSRQQAALKAASLEAEARRLFTEAVLAGVSAGVIGLDESGRIVVLNGQAARLIDIAETEAVGRPLAKIAPELASIAALAEDEGEEIEREVDLARGSEACRLRVRASRSAKGLVLTFDDITRLVLAQRSAVWRDVARRIAHEIKNPLTPIQLSAERLRRKYRPRIAETKGDLETFDRCTETIVRQVGDIGRMVDEFSAFARMPAPQFAACEAAELLREAVFAQRVADPDARIELVEPLASAELSCDSRIVVQALANVLKNAGEAITARSAHEPSLGGWIRAEILVDTTRLEFRIEDNGVGLPAKDRERLTEPYVTTREKGTGLGLAIVDRALADHGGSLALADAADGPGARVSLFFPLLRRPRRRSRSRSRVAAEA
ncbi:MAG: sensor histidine kinase, partial [Caulobacteraceae bacterium]